MGRKKQRRIQLNQFLFLHHSRILAIIKMLILMRVLSWFAFSAWIAKTAWKLLVGLGKQEKIGITFPRFIFYFLEKKNKSKDFLNLQKLVFLTKLFLLRPSFR